MTSHKYYKRGLVTAEQFDGSREMAERYKLDELLNTNQLTLAGSYKAEGYTIQTLEGSLVVNTGDWIATGVNGEHWPIADDIFHKTYAELPVIPQAVAYAIEWFQQNDETIGEIWRNLYEDVDDDWKQVPNLREPEEWMLDHQDTFTMAWSLGEWEVENG